MRFSKAVYFINFEKISQIVSVKLSIQFQLIMGSYADAKGSLDDIINCPSRTYIGGGDTSPIGCSFCLRRFLISNRRAKRYLDTHLKYVCRYEAAT